MLKPRRSSAVSDRHRPSTSDTPGGFPRLLLPGPRVPRDLRSHHSNPVARLQAPSPEAGSGCAPSPVSHQGEETPVAILPAETGRKIPELGPAPSNEGGDSPQLCGIGRFFRQNPRLVGFGLPATIRCEFPIVKYPEANSTGKFRPTTAVPTPQTAMTASGVQRTLASPRWSPSYRPLLPFIHWNYGGS